MCVSKFVTKTPLGFKILARILAVSSRLCLFIIIVICFVLLSGADSGSLLLLEWDGFVSYIECWTSALGSDVTLPVVKVWREGKDCMYT